MSSSESATVQDLQDLDPYEFEHFVASVWEARGWETDVSQQSNDPYRHESGGLRFTAAQGTDVESVVDDIAYVVVVVLVELLPHILTLLVGLFIAYEFWKVLFG